ncbi:protein containing DUF45 [methanotrophic bacterial endosymbiont of Bathymodiolus sp.]|nr:protein containing DUF45 [methanotrophic bacterial endosymbiont of Bathymodiolus sp.]
MNSKQVYQIRRSQRTKRARIVVTADKVEVVAPLRMPERQIQQFMRAKLDWIESAQNKVQRHVDNIVSLAPELYQQGAMIPYLGKQYKLEIKFSQNRKIEIAFAQAFIVSVQGSRYQSLTPAVLSEEIRAALIIWMREAAGRLAVQTMDHYVLYTS